MTLADALTAVARFVGYAALTVGGVSVLLVLAVTLLLVALDNLPATPNLFWPLTIVAFLMASPWLPVVLLGAPVVAVVWLARRLTRRNPNTKTAETHDSTATATAADRAPLPSSSVTVVNGQTEVDPRR